MEHNLIKEKEMIGKDFEYEVGMDRKLRKAKVIDVKFHELLGKPVFIGISPFGNYVELSRAEILHFLDENGEVIPFD